MALLASDSAYITDEPCVEFGGSLKAGHATQPQRYLEYASDCVV